MKLGFLENFKRDNLLKREVKIVEKIKTIFLIPVAVLVVAILAMSIYWAVLGSPLNLGTDFTGGYTIQLDTSSSVTDANYEVYRNEIEELINDYKLEQDGKTYSVNLASITRTGGDNESAIRVQFRADKSIPSSGKDAIMETISEQLVEQLNNRFAFIRPDVTKNDKTVTATYTSSIYGIVNNGTFASMLASKGIEIVGDITTSNLSADNLSITFTTKQTVEEAALIDAMTIADSFSAEARATDMISGTVSGELVISAITASLIALLLMLLYIIIRFEFASGVASVLALLHDIIIMFAFMIIFRIEFNSTFIAALIAMFGYSINNSIIVFDRVRENVKYMLERDKNVTSNKIANTSVIETLGRSVNTTATTLIMVGMIVITCAIGGITDLVSFGLPIIIGLVAGLFSSSCIAPCIWSLMRKNNIGMAKKPSIFTRKKATQDAAVTEPVVEIIEGEVANEST